MHSHMSIQLGDLIETFSADAADMVPDTAVFFHVLAEGRVATERLVAFRAFERFLTGMQAEVDLE